METIDVVTLIASVPAIVALVNLAKSVGLPSKWSPVVAIFLGVALNVLVVLYGDTELFAAVARGVIYALSASGLYDLVPAGVTSYATVDSTATVTSETPIADTVDYAGEDLDAVIADSLTEVTAG
jgi:hypothetical protein